MQGVHMMRAAVLSSLIVYVCAFMPIMHHYHLHTPMWCLPQNASLYGDLVPISTKMSSTQMQVMLALMKESPLRPLRNESRDYWRRLWVEFSDVAFPDAL